MSIALSRLNNGILKVTRHSNTINLFNKRTMSETTNTPSFKVATRLNEFVGPTVWHEFTPLAASTGAMNLGQGFPGWSPPQFVKDSAASAVQEIGHDFLMSQYARSAGHPALVKRLAEFYSPRLNHTINPLTEVLVTVGASEALCAFMLGCLNEGDEVVMLEPAFDIYIAQARMCQANIKFVPLRTRAKANQSDDLEWYLDMDELRSAFSSKTKLFILNTPHNPTGKVFTIDELNTIGDIVEEFDTILLSDEVYEHITYEGAKHVSPASLSYKLFNRTVTIGSAGKTFSVTGWKIGWLIGPPQLVSFAAVAHQWLTFSTCTPLQQAVADMIERGDREYEGHETFWRWLSQDYDNRREKLIRAIESAGLKPIKPQGGFFIIADTSNIELPEPYQSDKTVSRDWNIARWLCKEIGVCGIPPSAFYGEEHKHLAANYIRLAFCKPDDVLAEAAKRLSKCKDFIKN